MAEHAEGLLGREIPTHLVAIHDLHTTGGRFALHLAAALVRAAACHTLLAGHRLSRHLQRRCKAAAHQRYRCDQRRRHAGSLLFRCRRVLRLRHPALLGWCCSVRVPRLCCHFAVLLAGVHRTGIGLLLLHLAYVPVRVRRVRHRLLRRLLLLLLGERERARKLGGLREHQTGPVALCLPADHRAGQTFLASLSGLKRTLRHRALRG
mmetsp:Transcript_12243/g.37056  ORF Transcript_12243/g.37056 Transcript_12243/m.37056 type:complete len:207 (-) Transcript_12243:392-1012(-)